MERSEEVPHWRIIFPRIDNAERIRLVNRLRDTAIEYLRLVIATIPRAMSDNIKAKYQAKRVSVEWNLTTTDAYEFFFQRKHAKLSKTQESAAELLYACTLAIEENAVSDKVWQIILDAYAGLDLDAVQTGKLFTAGRQSNSGSPIRKAIADLLEAEVETKNEDLWTALSDKPPKGWEFLDNRAGRYAEGPKAANMGYRRFCNVCSEERKKIKEKFTG